MVINLHSLLEGKYMNRKAKIVATIGPASQDETVLERLIQAGVNVARMNFSHGTHEEHAEHITTIRRISEKLNTPVGILQDLQGPKIRVGELPAPLQLSEGEIIHLYATGTIPPLENGQKIPVDFRQLFDSVRTSDRLLLDDGRLTLEVVSVKERTLSARVIVGGRFRLTRESIYPVFAFAFQASLRRMKRILHSAFLQNVDAVAISFVRSART